MRILCLWFPRMAATLAVKQRPQLKGRPVVLLSGGPNPVVSGCSVEATARGVRCGMAATEAQSLAPAAAVLPDNASACLDELERLALIFRHRISERAEIAGRDHLFLDLTAAAPDQPEAALAARVISLARAWTALDGRVGVASSRRAALEAAQAARRFALILPPEDLAGGPAIGAYRDEVLAVERAFASVTDAARTRAALVRMLSQLQVILSARRQSYREAVVSIIRDDTIVPVTLRPHRPLHETGAVIDLLRRAVDGEVFAGAIAVRVELRRLGPDVRVKAGVQAAGHPPERLREPAAVR